MARQSRSGGSSRRPVAPVRQAPPQQTRPATTSAYPPANRPASAPTAVAPAQQAPQASAGPGLFGQMASTAAGVAVGSSIGHAIGGFFGGGSTAAAPEQAQQNNVATQQSAPAENNWGQRSCEVDAKQFTQCMDDNKGNMQICSWYLEQLKACQQASAQY